MKVLRIASLDKGYADPREVLLHVCFQCLADFVEKEKPETIVWDDEEHHRIAWSEIRSLYKWWKDERPARKDPLDSMVNKGPDMEEMFVPVLGKDYSRMLDLVTLREKYPEYYRAMDESIALDLELGAEDQLNLHRLIDVREFLWT